MTALGPTNAAEWMRQVNKDIADLKRHRHPDTTPVVDQALLEETVQAAVALGLETEVADPITPSTPIVQSGPGYVSVAWDGFGAGGEMLPSGFDHVTVHRSTEGPDFEPVTGRTDGSTEAITMRVPGAVVFNDQPYGVAYWYRLVMVNTVQEESAPSEAVEGTAVAVVSQADLDAIDAAVAQAQADADTAAAAAVAAQQAADDAQAAADALPADIATAKAEAIAAAQADATAKANAAEQAAKDAAALDATAKADAAQAAATAAAATDAQAKADAAAADAEAAAKAYADLQASGAEQSAIDAAAADAQAKADAAQAAAVAAAAADAQAKADAAEAAATAAAAADATAKADAAQQAAIDAAALDAQDRADLAQAAALADAQSWSNTTFGPTKALVVDWTALDGVSMDGGAIAAQTVTAAQILANTITANEIAANAITAVELAADAVLARNIKAGEVIAGKLAADSVVAVNIAADQIKAVHLDAGAVTADAIAADAVTATKIKAGEITAAHMVTGTITAASGVIGSIDAATITVGTIKAAQIGVGEITSVSGVVGDLSATHLKSGTLDANLVTVLNLDAGSITTGTLDAARIGAGSIDTIHLAAGAVDAASLAANVALIGKISSSEAGRRWEADPDGIRVYDDSGAVIVHFPTNLADSGNSIKGDLTATSLTIEDNLKIMGLVNEVSKGGRLVLSSGTTSPSSAPTLTMDWETYGPATDATFDPYKRGLALYAGKYYYTQDVYAQNTNIQRMNAATGAREFYGHQLSTVTWAEGGCTVLGGILYVLGKKQAGGWAVEKWDLLNDVRIGYWNWTAPGILSAEPAIGNDGTNILIGMTLTDNTVQWSTHTPSTGAQVGSTTVTNHATSRGVTAIMGGTFDFGASRVVMQFKDATDFQVFTTAGVRQTAEEWPVATGAKPRGATWDSARSQFVSYDPVAAKLHFYTGIKWTSESGTWWASYTWANPSTSSETTQSARRSVAMKKRSRLRVSLPARPVTDAAVTHSRVYLGRGGTDPGRTAMWLNGGDLTGTALVLSSVAFSGTNPPNASSFATSAPARVESGAGNLVLNGDGSGSAGALTWGTSATSKSTHAGPMDVLGTLLVNIEGSASPLVVGSATNTAEPSVRLRRNGADGLNTYEGYLYMWAGNASALSAQLRKNGAVVNRLDITDGYTSTDDEFRAPKVKSGTGDAQGTNYGEVYRSATQAIGSGAWTTISWNAWGSARVEDDGALYSSSHWRSNKAGWFSCSSSLTFATAGSGYRSLRIITEGGTVLARDGFDQGTTPFRDAHVSVNCALPGGAYGIRTEAYQNSGASINCTVHSSTEPTISRFGQNA